MNKKIKFIIIGGIMGLLFATLPLLISFIARCNFNVQGGSCPTLIMLLSIPTFLIFILLQPTFANFTFIFYLLIYIIVGMLIGWVVGEIKYKNK